MAEFVIQKKVKEKTEPKVKVIAQAAGISEDRVREIIQEELATILPSIVPIEPAEVVTPTLLDAFLSVTEKDLSECIKWLRRPDLCDIKRYADIGKAHINRMRQSGERPNKGKGYSGGQFQKQPVIMFTEYLQWRAENPDVKL